MDDDESIKARASEIAEKHKDTLLDQANQVVRLFGSLLGIVFVVVDRSHEYFDDFKEDDENGDENVAILPQVTTPFLRWLREDMDDEDAFSSLEKDDPDAQRIIVLFDYNQIVLIHQPLKRIKVQ